MNRMVNDLDKREKANNILSSKVSDDFKLSEMFNLYREEIRSVNVYLYYTLLGWEDSHKKELRNEKYNNTTPKKIGGV